MTMGIPDEAQPNSSSSPGEENPPPNENPIEKDLNDDFVDDEETIEGSDDQEEDKGTVFNFTHNEGKIRLDKFLCAHLPGRSRAFVQKLIEDGWVDLPGLPLVREIKASTAIMNGVSVQVTIPPTRKSTIDPEDIPLNILYEDEDLALVEKPAGIVMHPSPHQLEGTMVNALLYHLDNLSGIGGEERPGIVHRLDRLTSGIIVVAKSDRAHQGLSQQFKDRTIQKTYHAIVRGEWTAKEGTLDLPIGRSFLNRKRMMVRTDGQGRESITHYKIVEEFDGYAFIEVKPKTGRTHQIRVHMSKIRLPIACDSLYGREQWIYKSDLMKKPRQSQETPIIDRQALHASTLEFDHPITGERMTFNVPIPQDMLDLLEHLREYRSPKK